MFEVFVQVIHYSKEKDLLYKGPIACFSTFSFSLTFKASKWSVQKAHINLDNAFYFCVKFLTWTWLPKNKQNSEETYILLERNISFKRHVALREKMLVVFEGYFLSFR